MKGFTKDGKFRPTGKRSKSSLTKSNVKKVSTRSGIGHEMRDKKTIWVAKLEEPKLEEGTNTHLFELGEKATEHEVKNALMRMHREDGSPMYYEQDVNEPYLHYIKQIGETIDRGNPEQQTELVANLEELKTTFPRMSDKEKIESLKVVEGLMARDVNKYQGEKYQNLSKKTKDIAEDWWVAISEGGLAGDIMNVSEVYPSSVLHYEAGDPLSFDEFTDAEKNKLIERAGGENGMIDKIADEWQLDEDEVIQKYG